MNAVELTPELAALVNTARTLPAALVQQVADYADFLRSKHGAIPEMGRYGPVDYSDEWTEEDMRDATIASLRRFAEEHPDEDWGEDYPTPGEPPCIPPAT